jgi:YD repeat-containing protein
VRVVGRDRLLQVAGQRRPVRRADLPTGQHGGSLSAPAVAGWTAEEPDMRYGLLVAAFIAAGCTVAQAYTEGCARMASGNTGCARGSTHNNRVAMYSPDGRLLGHAVRRGNVQYQYDASGRRVGTAYYNAGNTDWKVYNLRGRLIGTRASYIAAGGR